MIPSTHMVAYRHPQLQVQGIHCSLPISKGTRHIHSAKHHTHKVNLKNVLLLFEVCSPVCCHAPLIPALGRQQQAGLREFKVRLFYIVCSRPARLFSAFNSGGSGV